MKNFKIFFGLATFFTIFISSICFAVPGTGSIPMSEIALGGIQLGATEERIRSIYGAPSDIEYSYGEFGHEKTLKYGTTLKFVLGEGNVVSITTTGNNGIKTPSGFTVGSRFSDVINYYNRIGTPDPYSGKIGDVSKNMARYYHEWYINLVFNANSNGKVTSISIVSVP